MRSLLVCVVLLVLSACQAKKKGETSSAEEREAPAASAPGAEDGGGAAAEAPALEDAAARAASAEPGLYFDRPITPADLEGRTLRELSLMRNTIFARAGNQFRKKWLRDHFTAQPWYEPLPELDESRISELDRNNAKLIAAAEASVSRADLEAAAARLQARLAAGQATPEDEIEIRLISARLGKWVGDSDAAGASKSPLEDPAMLDRLLTLEQLENMSRRDLRLLRNLVYARRGYQFKSPLLEDYFGATDWYQPDPSFTEKKLTAIDRKNIRLVRSVEDSLGGPLSDRAHMEEDGWFSGA